MVDDTDPKARALLPLRITDGMLTASSAPEPGTGEQTFNLTTAYKSRDIVVIGSPTSTVTITVGAPATVNWPAHGLPNGTPVTLMTTVALPAGLNVGQRYFIVKRTDSTFQLAETADGAPISTTGFGIGTHTAKAEVHRAYESLHGESAVVTTAIASPGKVGWVDHGLTPGTPVILTTTVALPTGLTAGTQYYVLAVTQNDFTVAATVGGSAINFTGTQSGVHTATANPNKGNPPAIDDGTHWATTTTQGGVGPSNRWAMFDYLTDQKTWAASPLVVTLTPGQRIDTVAFDGLVADAVVIEMSAGGGAVYAEEVDLSTRVVTNWLEYYTAPFTFKADLARFQLPLYTSGVLTLTFTRAEGLVGVGAVGIGRYTDIGTAVVEPEDDDLNFSTWERNNDGTPATLTQRRSSPKLTFSAIMAADQLPNARETRRAANAQPCFYFVIDDDNHPYFEALSILGIHTQWTHVPDQPASGYVTAKITIEGP